MRLSLLLGLVCAGFALFGTGLLAAALWVLADGAAGDPERLGPLALLLGGGGALAFAAAGGLAYVLLHRRIERPLAGLARQVRTLSHAPLGQVVEPPAGQALEPLAGDLVALSRELIRARRDMTKAVAAAGVRLDEQKGWLEAILLALGKGVIVCNAEHRILLYNQAARQILKDPAALGLDQSLFGLIGRAPVLHALERLKLMARDGQVAADQRMATLVCATLERKILLDARLTLILGPDREPAGYVLNFDDFSREMLEVTRRDALLQAATEGLRAPVANLRAAAETLVAHPTLSAEQRRAFEAVVASESEAISAEIDRLAERRHELSSGRWPMAEVYSADLISCIVQHLAERRSLKLTMVGIPIWLYCDSHSLMLAIEALIERLAEHAGVEAFDIGARQEGSRAYLDMVWDGEPVPSRTLESWLDTPLEGALGCETIRQALDLHGSDLWSRAQGAGRAVVHLPVAAAGDIERDQIAESLPPRPEFYDFDLLQRRDTPGALRARPLRELTFVVFDTETTGLSPSQGDEMISIGAVRVVNGRVLSGETFERLINPGRPIPKASVRFHGLTDEMVRDKPPVDIVLPQFKEFVGDAVLVAHNAAFDLKFLELKQARTGVVFDNPVLDTLLLSVFLHGDTPDHSLDAIVARFEIEVEGRHSALGDALATAGVFVRMLDLLEAEGIRTLGQALEASEALFEIRRRQAEF